MSACRLLIPPLAVLVLFLAGAASADPCDWDEFTKASAAWAAWTMPVAPSARATRDPAERLDTPAAMAQRKRDAAAQIERRTQAEARWRKAVEDCR